MEIVKKIFLSHYLIFSRDAKPELEGLNMDTFKQLTSLVTSGMK